MDATAAGPHARAAATSAAAAADRVRTGIPGLDELVGGGLLRNSVVLLGGDTGTGKTVLATQFLYAGALKYAENGMFLSFSQSKEAIQRSAAAFGWDLGALEKSGRLVFERYQPKDVMEIVREGGGTIRDTVEAYKIRRVVVDPLTAYSMMFEGAFKEQQELLELYDLFRSLNCTTLAIADEPAAVEGFETSRAEFLSDGIVHLYHVQKKGARVRAIEVVKMRYSQVVERVCPMRIDANGVTVYPNIPVFEA